MEDLRETAYAYLKAWKAAKGNEDEFKNFFNEMDTNKDEEITFDEFRIFMNDKGYTKFGNDEFFFKKLTRNGRDHLIYGDVVMLVYIINSGRPFCNECKYFIDGTFFTCVTCYEQEKDFHYNICRRCYEKNVNDHGHKEVHKEFVDTLSLLRLHVKMEPKNPSTSTHKNKHAKMRKQGGLLELMQVAAGCATIAAAASQCTIM